MHEENVDYNRYNFENIKYLKSSVLTNYDISAVNYDSTRCYVFLRLPKRPLTIFKLKIK